MVVIIGFNEHGFQGEMMRNLGRLDSYLGQGLKIFNTLDQRSSTGGPQPLGVPQKYCRGSQHFWLIRQFLNFLFPTNFFHTNLNVFK